MRDILSITSALADGSRLRVFAALTRHDELCVCEVTELLKLAPATVSRHMSVLQNARLVQSRKSGRWVYYRLATGVPPRLLAWLKQALAQTSEMRADDARLAAMTGTTLKTRCPGTPEPAKSCTPTRKRCSCP